MNEWLVDVVGLGIWMPGVPDLDAFVAGARGRDTNSQESPPRGDCIERRSRRRASALSRAMAEACSQATVQAKVDPKTVATVFGSMLGEAGIMLTLLHQLWSGEEMSPMKFATSVHSAAAGVVSISAGNRAFTTSLSADHDTVSSALTEAGGLIATTGEPAIVICGDDASPDDFVEGEDSFELMAAAVALAPVGSAKALATITLPRDGVTSPLLEPASLPERIALNPQAGLIDLVAAVARRDSGELRLDRGRGSGASVALAAKK